MTPAIRSKPINQKERDIKEETSEEFACPDCGAPLRFAEGCVMCPFCGWSKCG